MNDESDEEWVKNRFWKAYKPKAGFCIVEGELTG